MKKLLCLCLVFLCVGCVQKENICKYEIPDKIVVSFRGVGDNLIHDTIYKDAYVDGSYDFSSMYEMIEPLMKESDLAFINQETIVGGQSLGLSGYPSFNSPTEIVTDLQEAGFNLVNLATNHSLDRFQKGIDAARDAFDKSNLIVDGIYRSQEEYDSIVTFEKKGITFSFLAYTYGSNGISAPYPYSLSYFDEETIRNDIEKAKQISDVIIVSAHWGDENSFIPNDFQKYYAQLFADLGVDVVIGTHPHTIQPVEWVKGENGNETLVVYSLGNFLGGMLTKENALGGMIQFDFVKEKDEIHIENVKWQSTMIHFEGNQSNIMEERYHYKTYLLNDYNEELLQKHVLNGYEESFTLSDLKEIEKNTIDASFLEESWNG